MKKPGIFISSSLEGLRFARELGNQLSQFAQVAIWQKGAFSSLGKTAIESLSDVANRSDFAVFILTGESFSHARRGRRRAPRDNFLFELGFVAGRIGMARTIVVVDEESNTELPSDLAGVSFVAFRSGKKRSLKQAILSVTDAIQQEILKPEPRSENPIEFYSCFISYSAKDTDFAVKLHDDLQKVGVRCWLDVQDLKAGDLLFEQIQHAIQIHDKVLLILSHASVRSLWVQNEIRTGLEIEKARKETVLFPVRIDDSVFGELKSKELTDLKRKYIVDFSKWTDQEAYRREFKRLVRDLAISASAKQGGGE